jgi:hypothetical protein
MFRRDRRQSNDDDEIAVDVTLEDDLNTVEQWIETYIQNPSTEKRKQLLAALEGLDDQIDRSDTYEGRIGGSPAFGYAAKGSVIGETSSASPAEQIPGSVLRAQTVLIRAAKQEVTAPTPDTFAELRAANAALIDARTTEQPAT